MKWLKKEQSYNNIPELNLHAVILLLESLNFTVQVLSSTTLNCYKTLTHLVAFTLLKKKKKKKQQGYDV